MKLKSKLKLYEQFTGESKPAKVTPTDQVSVDQVSVDKVTPSDVVRTEVITDVNSILSGLEELSNQITEEMDDLLESTDYYAEVLNEGFMEDMIKRFQSMKSFAILNGAFKGLYKNQLKVELKHVDTEAEFDSTTSETKEKAMKGIKAKFDAKAEQIRAKKELPAEKRSEAVKALRTQQKDQLADKGPVSAKLDKKVASQKTQLQMKHAAELRDAKKKVSDLEAKNKPEGVLLNQWEVSKIKIMDALDYQHEEDKYEAKAKYDDSDNPELAEKRAKIMKERQATEKKEKEKLLAQKIEGLKEAQAEADARAEEGDDKAKAANKKISEFYKASVTLIASLDSVNAKDYDDARKLEIKKLKKAYSDSKDKISGTTYVDGGVAADKDEGDEIKLSMLENADEALDEFKDVLEVFDTKKSETEQAIEDAKKIEDKAANALDMGEDSSPEDLKELKKAYFTAQIATQEAKKADAEANEEDGSKFDGKITELTQKISDLDGGGEPPVEALSAEDVAKAELVDDFDNYQVITDEQKEAKVTVPGVDGEPDTEKPEFKDIKTFNGKDAEGEETDEVLIYAKINESVIVDEEVVIELPKTIKLDEGLTIAQRFAKLM